MVCDFPEREISSTAHSSVLSIQLLLVVGGGIVPSVTAPTMMMPWWDEDAIKESMGTAVGKVC